MEPRNAVIHSIEDKIGDAADNHSYDDDHDVSSAKDDRSPKSNSSSGLHELFVRFEAFNFDHDKQFQTGLSRITKLSSCNSGQHRSTDAAILKVKAFYYSKHVEPLDFSSYMEWSEEQKTKHHAAASSQQSPTHPPSDVDQDHQPNSALLQPSSADSQFKETKQTGDIPVSVSEPVSADAGQCEEQKITSNCESDSSTKFGCEGNSERDGCESNSDKNCESHSEKQCKSESGNTVTLSVGDADREGSSMAKAGSESDNSQELSFAELAELIQSGKPIPGLSQVEVFPTNADPTPSRLHRAKKPWEE